MKLFKKILLVFLLIGISLISCEIIVRKFFDFSEVAKITFKGDLVGKVGASFKLSDDPVLLYEWKNLSQNVLKIQERDTFRIIVLGDSVTYRRMWTMNDYYPKLLEDLLNNNSDNLKYEVFNAGVPGYNTIQEVRYLEKRLLRYLPDMIIVGYTAPNDRAIKRKIIRYKDGLYCSDVRESYPYVLELPFNASKFLLSKSAFYRSINFILAKIQLDFAKRRVKYFDLSFETENAVKRMKEISSENDFDLLFVVFPGLHNGSQREVDWIIAKCKKYGIKYLDLRDIFGKTGYGKIKISDDDITHPNKIGQHLAAEAIFEYFKQCRFKNVYWIKKQ